MTLACPHCTRPVAAYPLGRWFSRFQCPHCGKALQFDTRTNVLGAAGWIAAMAASYALRRIEIA